MKIRVVSQIALVVVMLAGLLALPLQTAQAFTIPTFSIVSVSKDVSVTIRTCNFPASQTFTVSMGAYGTRAIGGTVVGTVDSGAGGSFTATYSIPSWLAGSGRIAIRMDGSLGYYSYNWFYNNVSAVTSTPVPTAVPGYAGIPTFTIASVSVDSTVTITTNNFPAGKDFAVSMGAYGTQGIGGTVVATTNSGSGGSFSATYTIPSWLVGSGRIAIRMEATNCGFFAYNWFWNNTAP
jgi:hypothetical protein